MTPTGKVNVVGHERASDVFRDARYVGMFMRDASLMAAKDDPFVVAVERQKLHPETGSGVDGKLMTLLAELRKTNGNKLKDQIGLVSGWHITRGFDGCRARTGRGKGRFFFGVGPIGFRRRFTYDRQTRIVVGETSYWDVRDEIGMCAEIGVGV